MSDTTIFDCKQQPVDIGDIIRVTTLSKQFIKSFPEDERILIESMVGNFFKIIANIGKYGIWTETYQR